MTFPRNRSGSVRKKSVRVPGGKTVLRYVRRKKGGKHSCAVCGALLAGTSSAAGLAASERVPNRLFGGHLCHACTRKVVVYAARIADKAIDPADVELRYKKYVESQL